MRMSKIYITYIFSRIYCIGLVYSFKAAGDNGVLKEIDRVVNMEIPYLRKEGQKISRRKNLLLKHGVENGLKQNSGHILR